MWSVCVNRKSSSSGFTRPSAREPAPKVSQPKQQVANGASELPAHRVSSPSLRISSPLPRVPSPQGDPTSEAKLEKGPVHQFKKTSNPKMTHSTSDPSISLNRPKNFNAKPRPFGKTSADNSPTVEVASPLISNNKTSTGSSSSLDANNQSHKNVDEAESTSKRNEGNAGKDGASYAKAYPPAPIMGKQGLSFSTGQSSSSTQRQDSSSLVNTTQPKPRYEF